MMMNTQVLKQATKSSSSRLAKGLSIYVHWPFCKSICPYCDFNRYKREHIDHERMRRTYNRVFDHFFLSSLEQDNNNRQLLFPYTHVESIFFGGGTPSTADPEIFHDIIQRVHKWNQSIKSNDDGDDTSLVHSNDKVEVTMEANPTSIEISKLSQFKDAGINRLSIGVQSFDKNDLAFLGREHSVNDAKKAIETAQNLFNDRVSIDLMFGTPQHANNEQVWSTVLKEALSFNLKHLSLYQLTIEKYTQFHKRAKMGEFVLPDEDCSERLYQMAIDHCAEHGLEQYEISNFAAPGRECRHNLQYWRSGDYFGMGPGAHSRITTLDNQRFSMVQIMKPEDWMLDVDNNSVSSVGGLSTLGNIKYEHIAPEERIEELFMMALRLTKEGLRESELGFHLGRDGVTFDDVLNRNVFKELMRHEFILLESENQGDRRLKVTSKGSRVLDELLGTILS